MAPIDVVFALVTDELRRRQDRLLERRHKLARFSDPERSLNTFDFDFNKKMNRALVYELATARFIAQRDDVLFLGPPGTGKSHLAQAIGRAAILGRPCPLSAARNRQRAHETKKNEIRVQKGRPERGKTPRNVGNEPTTQTRTIWRWPGVHRGGTTNTAAKTFVPARQENRGLAQHICERNRLKYSLKNAPTARKTFRAPRPTHLPTRGTERPLSQHVRQLAGLEYGALDTPTDR